MLNNESTFIALNETSITEENWAIKYHNKKFIKKRIKKWTNDSLTSFIKSLNMAPNCLVCSKEVLDLITDKGSLVQLDSQIYWYGNRVVLVEKNIILWYKYNNEADIEEIHGLVNDIDTDVIKTAQEEYFV